MPLIHCATISEINWQPAEAAPLQVTAGVHVWRLHLAGTYALTPLNNGLLNTAEQQRAISYHQDKDRRRFVLSRAALRCVLSRYTGIAAAGIVFATGSNKKPYLPGSPIPLHYNVAHAGEYVLIAVSDMAVGVDTEYISPAFDHADIVETSFSAEEREAVTENAAPKRTFFQCWTRKEALLKATGKGMDDGLPLVPSLDGNYEVDAHIIGADSDWNVLSFATSAHDIGCVACNAGMAAPLFFDAQHILSAK